MGRSGGVSYTYYRWLSNHCIFLHEHVDTISKWSWPVLVPEPDEPVEHRHVGEDLPGEHLQLGHTLRLPSWQAWVELCFKLFLSTEPYPSFTFVLHVDGFNTLKEKKRKVFVYIEIYFPVFILRGVEISTLVPPRYFCLRAFMSDEIFARWGFTLEIEDLKWLWPSNIPSI